MLQPYQCLVTCGKVLIAANISCLDSFNIEDGSILSRWSYSTQSRRNRSQETAPDVRQFRAPEITSDSGTPSKRRRSSTTGDEGECTDGKAKRHALNENKPAKGTSAIVALASTSDARHIIAITGEDKAIRVFEHDGKGTLQQVSQRTMPKRPCALAVIADDSTIICADKFGDVYSLPLLYDISHRKEDLHGLSKVNVAAESQSKPFVPAANKLTVHSVRNLRALQSQMKQTQKALGKPELDFERKLLLGHVSMLTDIAAVEREGRNYIITADRDEHIRISRGIPQAYIVERYCSGHKEFVSRLCFPGSRQNVLISGGGDDDIYVWDWYLGLMIQSVNLRKHVENTLSKTGQIADENGKLESMEDAQLEEGKIAVSNIIYLGDSSSLIEDTIVVTCEGVPALFVFALLEDSSLCYHSTLPLEGNPLDVVASTSIKSIIVSIDTIHRPGSTTKPRTVQDNRTQLQAFKMADSGLACALQFESAHKPFEDNESDTLNVSCILYSIANLRKRGGEE